MEPDKEELNEQQRQMKQRRINEVVYDWEKESITREAMTIHHWTYSQCITRWHEWSPGLDQTLADPVFWSWIMLSCLGSCTGFRYWRGYCISAVERRNTTVQYMYFYHKPLNHNPHCFPSSNPGACTGHISSDRLSCWPRAKKFFTPSTICHILCRSVNRSERVYW